MFGKGLTIFRLAGFDIRLDPSWFFLALLLTWTLAVGYFPFALPGLSGQTYWLMGLIGAFGLFASIVVHELAHAVVARKRGMKMGGITLFLFGGVSEMHEEPPDPKTEAQMALAGPFVTLMVVLLFLLVTGVGIALVWPAPLLTVTTYLAVINALLFVFNLVPAFPLDGGRALRAALWKWKGNLAWATRVASRVGVWFGIALILLGILSMIGGNFMGGLWWVLIGLFLQGAANRANEDMAMRQELEHEPVRRFMRQDPVSVPPHISLNHLIEEYFYRHYHKTYPVVEPTGKLLGCVRLDQVKSIPREEWDRHEVEEVVQPCSEDNTIPPDTDAYTALNKLQQTGGRSLMVVEAGTQLVGVVALRDLIQFFQVRKELQQKPT